MMRLSFLLELILGQVENLNKKLTHLNLKVKLFSPTLMQKRISQTNIGMKLFPKTLGLLILMM